MVLDDLHLTRDYVESVSRIFIVACGSSYHVGMVSKYNWERLLRRPVEVCLASEFRYCDPLVDEHALVIFISQSARRWIPWLPCGSQAAGRPDAGGGECGWLLHRKRSRRCALHLGRPEIAVATTKAYSTQLALMDLIALYLGDLLGTVEKSEYDQILREMERLPENVEKVLESTENVKYFASGISTTIPSSSSDGIWIMPWAWRGL